MIGLFKGNAVTKKIITLVGIFIFTMAASTSKAQPRITSVTPTTGKPGDTIVIVGTSFTGTVASTEVYFGNARVTTYRSASSTTLRVIVPIGATYGPITVLDKLNKRYGASRQFFSPIYSPKKGSFDAGDMTTSSIFSSGTNPYNVAVGDIDGDGKSDAVVVNYSDNTVSVLRNTSTVGNVNFATKVDFATGLNPYSVAVADIDNDAKLDIIVVNNGASSISVLKNTSTSGVISFAAKVDKATGLSGSGSTGIAVADIDFDGLQDVVVCNGGNNKVSVLVNSSTTTAISFATKVEYTTGTTPRGIAIGDIDGDTRLDIIVTNAADGTVSIIRNTTAIAGSLSLAAKVDYTVGTDPVSVALGDIDGDGKLDVITSNYNSGNISTLKNTSVSGTIALNGAVNKTTTPFAETVAIADIDADGKLDITNSNNASSLAVLKNTTTTTTPTYALAVTFGTGSLTYAHALGDIDGDGKIDAVVVTNFNNGIVVVRNAPVFSSNTNLSFLTTTAGAITPIFSANILNYSVSVANTISSITITPTKQQDSAKLAIQLNGGAYTSIASGSPSSALALILGDNIINIKVTAQDGTIKTYTLTVTRAAPPTITSISPTSGAVGTTVTITGTFFNSIPANNVVFFGATQATVTAATTTSLTVTVPTSATYAPITVFNVATLLTGASKQYFNTTFTPNKGSITNMDMTVSSNFAVNSSPYQVAVGDIDGDGKADAVVVDYDAGLVSVLKNTSTTGNVNFAAKIDFNTTSRPYSVALGDINNDGKLDIVTADFLSNTISVFRNTSTSSAISFAARVDKISGLSLASHQYCAIADFDGDGKQDVIISNKFTTDISVLRNTSTISSITFDSYKTFATVSGPVGLAVGDIDNDGKPDVVVTGNTNLINGTVSILRNTSTSGNISFATKSDYTVGGGCSYVTLGDMNGDGYNDIVTGNSSSDDVSVLVNYSVPGTLFIDAAQNFTTVNGGSTNCIADFDGDGKLDIAVTGTAGGIYVLRNTTTATYATSFAAPVIFASATYFRGVATGDIDGDGKADIAAIGYFPTILTVLRNTPAYSTNANLSSLAISTGTLTPVFDSLTTAYTTNVLLATTSMTVTPNVVDTNSTIQVRINGGTYASVIRGTASAALSLSSTINTIDVKVTAQDGTTIKTYTITVTKISIPSIVSFTPTNGAVGTLVTITGTNLNNPTTLNIGGVAAVPISNTGTSLVAMVMPGATSGTVYLATVGGIVNKSFFTVTPTLFPSAQQGSKLVGTGNVGTSSQGVSVAISADGNTAIVGGYNDNTYVGGAWIYTRTAGVWTQQGSKLVGTGNIGQSYQGISVALSADGNNAIVGGFNDNSGVGAAWIFTRNGANWSQQGSKLVGTGYTGIPEQGYSVAMSADGNTAVVGGDNNNFSKGAVWIYTRSGATWTQQAMVTGTGFTGTSPQIGHTVALSADGNTLLAGGFGDNSNIGATWVFKRTGSTWTQQGNKLVGTGRVGAAKQSNALALSADGNTAVIGGFEDNASIGATWIFTRSGSTWAQQGNKLVANDFTGAPNQGKSVSVSADGNTVIVGGYADNSSKGASWIYTRNAGLWTQKGNKIVGTGASLTSSMQGSSVAVSADGTTGFVGGAADNANIGAAWAYTLSSNANLANLIISTGTLSPTFASATLSYIVSTVSNATTSVTVTPQKADSAATIQVQINGGAFVTVNSGSASQALNLNMGSNLITIRVTAQDGTLKYYTISITRNCGVFSSRVISICPSQLPYTWNGLTYTAAGSQTYYTTSSTLCDSAATMDLVVKANTYSTTDVVICINQLPYTWNGVSYTASGSYSKTGFTNSKGCDSVAYLNLTVNNFPNAGTISGNSSFCFIGGNTTLTTTGDAGGVWTSSNSARVSVQAGFVTASMGGNYTIYYAVSNACSTSVTGFNIKVNVPSTSVLSVSICNSYTWGGTTYTSSGTYTKTGLKNVGGCDSTSILELTIKKPTTSSRVITICSSELPYTWNGLIYTAAGSKTYHTTNSVGCDSAATMDLVLNEYDVPNFTISSTNGLSVCVGTGTVLTVNGINNKPGTVTFTVGGTTYTDSITASSLGNPYLYANLGASISATSATIIANDACSPLPAGSLNGRIALIRRGTCTFATKAINARNAGAIGVIIYNNVGGSAAYTPGGADTAVTFPVFGMSQIDGEALLTLLNANNNTISTNIAAPKTYFTVDNFTSNSSTPFNVFADVITKDTTISITVYAASGQKANANNAGYGLTFNCTNTQSILIKVLKTTSSITNASICNGDSILFNGTYYKVAGAYTAHLTNSVGCDSSATLNLTLKTSTSSTTYLNICENQLPYTINGLTFAQEGKQSLTLTNANGCDSVITYILSFVKDGIISNAVITQPKCDSLFGSISAPYYDYTRVFRGTIDSTDQKQIGRLNITAQPSSSCSLSSINPGLLASDTKQRFYESYTLTNTTGATACVSVNLKNYNPSNIYTIAAYNGSFNSTNPSQNYLGHLGSSLGLGNAYFYFSVPTNTTFEIVVSNYFTGNFFGDYILEVSGLETPEFSINNGLNWQNSNNFNAVPIGNSNLIMRSKGTQCTTPYFNNPIVIKGKVSTASTTNLSICPSALPYSWNGLSFTAAGSQTKTGLTNSQGCDSSATLNLTVKTNTSSTTNLSICPSALPYSWNGLSFTATGSQTKTGLTNSQGCDSSATLSLTVKTNTSSTQSIAICPSQLPYNWNGLTFTTAGSQTKIGLINSKGCDSSATLNLIVKTNTSSTNNLSICPSQLPYSWNGLTFTAAAAQTKTGLTNSLGCDSSATLNLTVKTNTSSTQSISICSSELPYSWNGLTFTITGSQTKTGLVNSQGCDSSATLNLTVKTNTSSTSNLSICPSQLPYSWNGLTFTSAGSKTKAGLTNSQGCDSSATLNLTVKTNTSSTSNLSICPSQLPYSWNGLTFTVAGSKTKAGLTNSQGCDSSATLNLTVKAVTYSTLSSTICSGQTYLGHSTTGSFNDTLVNSVGCDSVRTLNLSVTQSLTPTINMTIPIQSICKGYLAVFNATTTNQGTNPVYKWYKNNVIVGTNSNTYTDSLLNNQDSIWCVLTSSETCVTANNIKSNVIQVTVSLSISGSVKTPIGTAIPNVQLYRTGSIVDNQIVNGRFNSSCINTNYNLTIRLTKNNDINKTNGINATDVLFVQRHILNTSALNSPYKLIAADVNGDKNINATDLLRIKRLILGTDTTFNSASKGNRLWEFIDSAYQFSNATNPFPFKDSISFNNMTSSKINQSFIGVKLGDVNDSWNASLTKGVVTKPIEFVYWSDASKALDLLRIPINVKNFKELVAMQYTLHFDNSKYEFVGIENNKLNIDFTEKQATRNGNIAMLWTDKNAEARTLPDGTELFTLVLRSKGLIASGELDLNNEITEVDAWDKDFNQHNIILTKQQKLQTPESEQWSVSPNPTSGEIKINLVSKVNKVISFELTDAQGKAILKQVIELQKGNNNFVLNLKQNGNIAIGIYFLKAVGIEGENVKRIMVK